MGNRFYRATVVFSFAIVAGLSLLLQMPIPVLVKKLARVIFLGLLLIARLIVKPLKLLRAVGKRVLLPFFELDYEHDELAEKLKSLQERLKRPRNDGRNLAPRKRRKTKNSFRERRNYLLNPADMSCRR